MLRSKAEVRTAHFRDEKEGMRKKKYHYTQKSNSKVTQLVHEVLLAPDFDLQDLSRFNASRETSWFDTAEKEISPEDVFSINKWKHTLVNITVPTRERKKKGNGLTFTVDGLCYRSILDVV